MFLEPDILLAAVVVGLSRTAMRAVREVRAAVAQVKVLVQERAVIQERQIQVVAVVQVAPKQVLVWVARGVVAQESLSSNTPPQILISLIRVRILREPMAH
jgi:hypothetical protein